MTDTHLDPRDQDLPLAVIQDLRETLAAIDQIRAGLAAREPVVPLMSGLCDFCDRLRPHVAWSMAKAIDYDSDQPRLRAWFEGVVIEDPPPANVNALYSGVMETGQNRDSGDFYVAGSATFGIDAEWTSRLTWSPKSDCAGSQAQAAIQRLAADMRRESQDLPSLFSYALPLAHAAAALSLVLEATMQGPATADVHATVLHAHDRVPVAVGFDDGDAFIIGAVVPQGFERGEFEAC